MGNLVLKNRIVMAPMNVGALNNSDGCLSERGIEYFTERARGGVGLIVTGAVRITREFERPRGAEPLLMAFADHRIHTRWINELADRCHDYGARLAVQLTPGTGRVVGRFAQEHGIAIAPSEMRCYQPPYKYARGLTKDDIRQFLHAFEFAASVVITAGADAIQLHGHEGYLMDQFTSSLWNHRTDEYGGSLENRLRFSKEVIEAIQRGAGREFPVIYRYGLSHFLEGGRSIDEGLEMARLLESYGVAALDVDAGCWETWYLAHPPTTVPPGSLASLAERVKSAVGVPVIASGKISYPEVAEDILSRGQADFISLGRPLIADPEWVKKAERRKQDIRPCIGCHEGCLKRVRDYMSISCAVNPAAGNERFLSIERAGIPRRVLVVGGGVAGMVASIVASMRGHKVLLIEKADCLGGNFAGRYLPEFKSDYRRYMLFLENQLTELGADVKVNHAFSESDCTGYMPDVVVIAVGATFKVAEIDGIGGMESVEPLECFSAKRFRARYAVIGGGLVGTEAAINIAQNGGEVCLIESGSVIAGDAYRPNRDHMKVLLDEQNVAVHVNTTVLAAGNNVLYCGKSDGAKVNLAVDKVVVCAGMTPNTIDAGYLPSNAVEVLSVGDCVKPGKAIDAVWAAYRKVRLV